MRTPPSSTAATAAGLRSFNVDLICRKIGDVNDRFGRNHATDKGLSDRGGSGEAPASLGEGRRSIVSRDEVKRFAVPAVDVSESGVANANGFLQHGCKDRLKIAGRA